MNNLKDQLQLSIDMPRELHASFRKQFEEELILQFFDPKYHETIRKVAKKKRMGIRKFIEGAVMTRLVRNGAWK